MLRRIFIGFLAICILTIMSSTKAAYDTSDLKNPHSQIFYLHSKTVNLNIEEQINRARNLIIQGKDYPMAIAVLNQIISLYQDDSEAYLLRGIAYTEMGEFWKAENDYKLALKLEPENPTFYYFRGMNFLHIKDRPSDGSYNRVTQNIHLGMSYAQVPKYTLDAQNMFEKALKIEPYYIDAIIGLGDSYIDMADYQKPYGNKDLYQKAIDEYNKVLVLFPNHDIVNFKKKEAQQVLNELKK